MELNKVILGVWCRTQKWHIVNDNTIIDQYFPICGQDLYISYKDSYLFPDGKNIKNALKSFNFNHICKRCLKIKPEATETIKTYIIYHKLGIKI